MPPTPKDPQENRPGPRSLSEQEIDLIIARVFEESEDHLPAHPKADQEAHLYTLLKNDLRALRDDIPECRVTTARIRNAVEESRPPLRIKWWQPALAAAACALVGASVLRANLVVHDAEPNNASETQTLALRDNPADNPQNLDYASSSASPSPLTAVEPARSAPTRPTPANNADSAQTLADPPRRRAEKPAARSTRLARQNPGLRSSPAVSSVPSGIPAAATMSAASTASGSARPESATFSMPGAPGDPDDSTSANSTLATPPGATPRLAGNQTASSRRSMLPKTSPDSKIVVIAAGVDPATGANGAQEIDKGNIVIGG